MLYVCYRMLRCVFLFILSFRRFLLWCLVVALFGYLNGGLGIDIIV